MKEVKRPHERGEKLESIDLGVKGYICEGEEGTDGKEEIEGHERERDRERGKEREEETKC